MSELSDILLEPSLRPKLIDACVRLIDDEVASKRGLSSLPIKGGFKAVKAVRPGFVRAVIDLLFDRFVEQMASYHENWVSGGKSGSFGAHLQKNSSAVANSLLVVTDERAARSDMKSIKKVYGKLRPSAQSHVASAIPGMARILDPHVS
ncbi:MAG: hypothetical protein KC502_15810 [Myxococcales bacterium]|nr:hypothetical protein [Myxococcales bacterium]